MTTVTLWGIAKAGSGGMRVRRIRSSVRILRETSTIHANVKLDEVCRHSLADVLQLIARDCASLGMIERSEPLGMEIRIDRGEGVDRLEDASFSLPLYAAGLGDVLGIPTRQGVSGTGVVLKGGSLGSVESAGRKAAGAFDQGEKLFVYPAQMTLAHPLAIPVSSARAGAIIWYGVDFLRFVAPRIADVEIAIAFIEDFFDGHVNSQLSRGLGDEIAGLVASNRYLAEAFGQYRGLWTAAALKHIATIPQEGFATVCQLLEPRRSFDAVWNDPREREKFLADSIRSLVDVRGGEPADSLRAATALIGMVGGKVDVSVLLRGESPLRAAILEIMSAFRSAIKEDKGTYREATRLSNAAAVLERVGSSSVFLPRGDMDIRLRGRVRYEDGKLVGLEWSFPDHPDMTPVFHAHPAALMDRSSMLPRAWRRSDWKEADSMLDTLPWGSQIAERFGDRNVFVFPSFSRTGIETKILWGDGTGTWPPSIDTLHLLGALGDLGLVGSGVRYDRVLDLGCGTGVLGLFLARNSSGINELDFLDIEPSARLTTTSNILGNLTSGKGLADPARVSSGRAVDFAEARVRILDTSAYELLKWEVERGGRYDLLICAPPYVPYLEVLRDPGMWRAVSGTDLLRFVLGHGLEIAARIVVQFSAIAFPEVEALLGDARPSASHRVGFRIPPLAEFFDPVEHPSLVKRGEAWLELVGGNMIDTELSTDPEIRAHHHGFRYFHEIHTYVLE